MKATRRAGFDIFGFPRISFHCSHIASPRVSHSKLHVPDSDVSVSIVDLRMADPKVPSSALQVNVDFTIGQWYVVDDVHVPFP